MADARLVKAVRLVQDVEIKWDEVDTVAMLEWRTRYALIDPLLRALGWDTGDPEMCFIEWPVRDTGGRVDYALFIDGYVAGIAAGAETPVVLVEAKAMNVKLNRHVKDLEKYADGSGLQIGDVAVLTNGRQWWLYEAEPGKLLHQGKHEVVDLVNETAEAVADRLETWLSRDNWW